MPFAGARTASRRAVEHAVFEKYTIGCRAGGSAVKGPPLAVLAERATGGRHRLESNQAGINFWIWACSYGHESRNAFTLGDDRIIPLDRYVATAGRVEIITLEGFVAKANSSRL